LWRGAFHVKDRESSLDTVARCYPMLIDLRRKSYETLAHCTVNVSELRSAGGDSRRSAAGVDTFLEMIRRQIEKV
jgi:hypothetical protein